MFVSSCLGSQVFKQKTLRRCSENPKEVMALELPILRGQIGCCWISDEMVGRWVLFFFGKNLLWYLNSNLLNFGRCLSILWKNIVETNWKEIWHNQFFSQTQCYWVGIIHHYIGMYHTACSDLQVPPEELCHKLRFLYADVEYGAMTITKRRTRGNGFEYRRFAELTAQELGNPSRVFFKSIFERLEVKFSGFIIWSYLIHLTSSREYKGNLFWTNCLTRWKRSCL